MLGKKTTELRSSEKSRFSQLLMASFLVLLLSACHLLSEPEPMHLLSLHRIADQSLASSRFLRSIQDATQEKQVQIVSQPFLDSRVFYKAETVRADNAALAGLRLYIDRAGKNLLLQTMGTEQGGQFAVIVDGFFIGMSRLPTLADSLEYIELAPLWGATEAENIAQAVSVNYEKVNKF